MSKSSSHSSTRRYGRGALATSSASRRPTSEWPAALPRPVSVVARSYGPDEILDLPITDRRLFYPVPPPALRPTYRAPALINGSPARVVAPPLQKRATRRSLTSQQPFKPHKPLRIPAGRLLFDQPEKVAVCVQRGVRKEVLHAKRIAGRKNLAKPKRGPSSSISCRK